MEPTPYIDVDALKTQPTPKGEAAIPATPDAIPDDKESLAALVRLMLADRQEALLEKQQTKARREEARAQMRAEVERARQEKEWHQNNCTHTHDNGKTAKCGQIHNDGLYHPICVKCLKEFTPIRPYKEQNETALMV